jgi:hypothetical protein
MPLRPLFSLVLPLWLSFLLAGCGEEATAPHPDMAFADLQRVSCPQSPTKYESQVAPKRSAAARVVEYHWDIYTSKGVFINEADGTIDPESLDPLKRNMLVWDGRDFAGRPVPSAYYISVVAMWNSGSSVKETRVSCAYVFTEADQDKVK